MESLASLTLYSESNFDTTNVVLIFEFVNKIPGVTTPAIWRNSYNQHIKIRSFFNFRQGEISKKLFMIGIHFSLDLSEDIFETLVVLRFELRTNQDKRRTGRLRL